MSKSLLTQLDKHSRVLMESELQPVQGHRFQATGFPDLGPARYQAPDGMEMLLVESAQSMANRMEAVCWDPAESRPIENLKGMPYIRVEQPDGTFLTSSILEAHRINSPYILEGEDKSMMDKLKSEASGLEFGAVDVSRLAHTIFKYDSNAVLHGVFLAKKDLAGGRLRLPRVLTGFIEAENVAGAESGGVKNDRVDPSGDTKRGFGNVPFHRTEFVAGRITAYFSIDLALLRSYRLDEDAQELLLGLALFKIQRFLYQGLRLRTACDLQCSNGVTFKSPEGFDMPDEETLLPLIGKQIAACSKKKLFADPPVTTIAWKAKKKDADKGKENEAD